MADNVATQSATLATVPAATNIATDQLAGGEHVQFVKLMDGTLDGSGKIAGDAANGLDVDVTRVSGVVHVDDNAASLTVDPNTGTVWDVSDRAARLVGVVSGGANVFHVDDNAGTLTVDAPVGTPVFCRLSDGAAALIGQKAAAASLPVVPASDWLTEAVPTGGFGNPALRVFVNSIRKATYSVPFRNIASGALTANTAKAILSLEHAATATKTVRIRRIWIGGRQTTGLAGILECQLTTGTAASSAGTAVTPSKANQAQAAAEVVAKTLPTITAATVSLNAPLPGAAAAAAQVITPTLVYDWSEAGSTEPLTLRAGVLESLVLNLISDVAMNLTVSGWVELTEE